MKHLISAALLLTAILFAPRLYAQASNTASATAPAATPPSIQFDVVLLKRCAPNEYGSRNTVSTGDSWARHCQPIKTLIDLAYGGGSAYLVKGEPDWVDSDLYDFQAKVAPEDAASWQKMDIPTKRLMIRAALPDALKLKVHIEIQTRPVYNLVVAKGGPKLTESKPDPNAPTGIQAPRRGSVEWVSMDEAVYMDSNIAGLADALAARLDRDVINKTGLTGYYDFHVKPLPLPHYDTKTSDVESTDFAGIIDGVKTLGLKLESGKADTNVIVIDHIERPAEN